MTLYDLSSLINEPSAATTPVVRYRSVIALMRGVIIGCGEDEDLVDGIIAEHTRHRPMKMGLYISAQALVECAYHLLIERYSEEKATELLSWPIKNAYFGNQMEHNTR